MGGGAVIMRREDIEKTALLGWDRDDELDKWVTTVAGIVRLEVSKDEAGGWHWFVGGARREAAAVLCGDGPCAELNQAVGKAYEAAGKFLARLEVEGTTTGF